jgi:two-component system OmpR family sensor kinase
VRHRAGHRLRAPLANASLRVRVMAAAAVLVAVTSAVMGLLSTALVGSYLVGRADSQLASFGAVTGRLLTRLPPALMRPGPSQLPSDFLVEIIYPGDRAQVAGGSAHDAPLPQIPASRLDGPAGPFTATAGGGHSWRVLVRPLPGGRHAVIALSLDPANSTIAHLEIADALAGVAAVAVLAGIGFPLVRASLRPLAKIEDTAAAIAAGDLSRRISHPPQRTEVGRLTAALNTMLGRIETAYRAREEGEAHARDSEDKMRRFVADASHELRTPLTSVKGLAELCLRQGDAASRAEATGLVTGIQQEATRMSLLVDDLLLLAQLDQARPLQLRPVDLTSVAAEAVQSARAVQPDRPLALSAAPDPVIVNADDARLRQVIDNLLSNALRHTPATTPVTVTVDTSAGCGQLTVTDQGPGMTAEQAARVFERFYRTDTARSRAHGGTGLGLSIASALVSAHQGTISVNTRQGHGTAFRVLLPLAVGAREPGSEPFA